MKHNTFYLLGNIPILYIHKSYKNVCKVSSNHNDLNKETKRYQT